ncbi:unnamed protein product [Scytosiphon promiscuus]
MRLYSPAAGLFLLLPLPPKLHAVDLAKIQKITQSSASHDFAGGERAYAAACNWYAERLLQDGGEGRRAPHLVCADYPEGHRALVSLENAFSKSAIHRVSNSEDDGSCFIVTASPVVGAALVDAPQRFSLQSAAPLLPSLKLATGLVDHGIDTPSRLQTVDAEAADRSARLRSTYGEAVSHDNVRGLSVRLSPGILPLASDLLARVFVRDWQADLMSETVTMSTASFWSDPGADRTAQDKTRVREWSRAAAVVEDLVSKHGRPVGEICGLARLKMHHVGDDLLLVEGLDHLLPGREPPSEAKMACFMGLLSQLAAKPEVLRISPLHRTRPLNAVGNAVVQSATTMETPLLDAGLDGTGEVIQVVDSGLDETSCYFADDDGLQVEHGHLFLGVREEADGNVSVVHGSESFVYDMSRRKVVQYIELFKRPDGDGTDNREESFAYASDFLGDPYDYGGSEYQFFTNDDHTELYASDYWSDDPVCSEVLDDRSYYSGLLYGSETYSTPSSPSFTGGFYKDTVGGHGTWVAGSAAGSISAECASTVTTCGGDELPGCAGGCIVASDVDSMLDNGDFDLDTFCPMYDCDGDAGLSYCLSDDPVETIHQNSGVAPGAKLAVFDPFYRADWSDSIYGSDDWFVELAGNSIWYSSLETGAKIHSNSWGSETFCQLTEGELLYDTFMYENPENLIIFAAGNLGGWKDVPSRDSCTIGSPALGKNVLSVGATSSGPSRATDTGADGLLMYERLGLTDFSPEGYPWICLSPILGRPSSSVDQADIDTLAWFTSYGPTSDSRIKPEVVAPGDQVFSAWSDGTDDQSCQLVSNSGTSASCPLVAGSAALVRQYFTDPSFFADDVRSRGACRTGCSTSLECDAFSPSAATVKAMIINSAHLMGGSSEPDGFRGFGRVHLEAGMPMHGTGRTGLLVVDSSRASISSHGEQTITVSVDGDAGVDLRATLCWIDPPATALSATQLQHDLDLVVRAPSGAAYTMWMSGEADTVNVIERVIVPAETMESGEWSIIVSAKGLLTDEQSYSLVITGAI